MNFYELADKYDVSRSCVEDSVKRMFPDVDTGRYECDEHLFEELDSDETYYWIGFLAADGCVYERGYGQKRLQIRLNSEDRGHLEKLKTFLNSDHAINTYSSLSRTGNKEIECCDLHVYSDRLCDDLTSYGVTQQKSNTIEIDQRLVNNRHFWRGVIDGDGCLVTGRKLIALYSTSKKFLEQYATWVQSFCSTETQISSRDRDDNWNTSHFFAVSGKYAIDVVEELYGGCDVALDRKLMIANQWLTDG